METLAEEDDRARAAFLTQPQMHEAATAAASAASGTAAAAGGGKGGRGGGSGWGAARPSSPVNAAGLFLPRMRRR